MENEKNGLRGSGKVSPSEGFYEKMYFREKFYARILKRPEWFKCATVLGLKNFTWFKELELDFGVHPSIANKFILECKDQGLVVSKLLSQLDNLYYEAIIRTKSVAFYEQVNNVNILTLTPDGVEFFKSFLEDNKEKIESENHLKFNYDEVQNKIKYLLSVLNEIKNEESLLKARKVTYPGVGNIMRDSEAQRQRQLDINKAGIEFRQELLARKKMEELTHKDKQYLVKVENTDSTALAKVELEKEDKATNAYDGIYSHLSTKEVEDMSQGISKEQEKEANKEHSKEIKEKIKAMNKQAAFVGKGYHNGHKKTEDEEALDFLNKL